MHCNNCNNNLSKEEKFCTKCGTKVKNDSKKLKLTLLRTILLTICILITLGVINIEISNDVIVFAILILISIIYIVLLFIVEKKLKIYKYSDCIFSNFISLILYAISIIAIFSLYGEMDCNINGRCGENYALLFMIIANIVIIPITFVVNAIIDIVIIANNNKRLK